MVEKLRHNLEAASAAGAREVEAFASFYAAHEEMALRRASLKKLKASAAQGGPPPIIPPAREHLLIVLAEAKVLLNEATKVAEALKQIHKKKAGRPQILPPEVYKAVQDYFVARADNGEIMTPITLSEI
eukprot:gene30211-35195_t